MLSCSRTLCSTGESQYALSTSCCSDASLACVTACWLRSACAVQLLGMLRDTCNFAAGWLATSVLVGPELSVACMLAHIGCWGITRRAGLAAAACSPAQEEPALGRRLLPSYLL
jgi:hypothetical protein